MIAMPESKTLGVDLGTSFTCAHQVGALVPMSYGRPTVPSVVRIKAGEWSVPKQGQVPSGDVCHLALNKLIIGRQVEDGLLKSQIGLVPHAKLDGAGPYYDVGGLRVRPEEVAGYLLGKVRLKHPGLTKMVITTPAYFTTEQRNATVDAAYVGGFDRSIVHTLPEPVAALIGYVWDLDDRKRFHGKTILVKDIGGGTADITGVRFTITEGRYTFNIRATAGDNWLGGQHFTEHLRVLVLEKAGNPKLSGDEMAELLEACDEMKQTLSNTERASVSLPERLGNNRERRIVVTRKQFEEACKPLLERIDKVVDELLSWREDIAQPELVLLVGGSCLMPAIGKISKERFPSAHIEVVKAPEEAIAHGASLLANNSDIEVMEVLPRGLSVEAYEGCELIPDQIVCRNAPLPINRSHKLRTNYPHQSQIDFSFYEGDLEELADNIRVGCFSLKLKQEDISEESVEIALGIRVEKPGSFVVDAKVGGSAMTHAIEPLPRIKAEELENMRRVTSKRLNPYDDATDQSDVGSPEHGTQPTAPSEVEGDEPQADLDKDGTKEASPREAGTHERALDVSTETQGNTDQGSPDGGDDDSAAQEVGDSDASGEEPEDVDVNRETPHSAAADGGNDSPALQEAGEESVSDGEEREEVDANGKTPHETTEIDSEIFSEKAHKRKGSDMIDASDRARRAARRRGD